MAALLIVITEDLKKKKGISDLVEADKSETGSSCYRYFLQYDVYKKIVLES